MNKVITEDIISRALNESIDEFMLEESMDEGIGSAIKGAWNGLKNTAAMYMDWRTNGQWNNKYGIYANGTGKTTEIYYLNKWFNTHVENIKQIEYKNNKPSGYVSRDREYYIDPQTNRKIYKDRDIDYDDVSEYVKQNITPENFNNWVGKYVQNRMALKLIDDYILKCQKQILQNPTIKTAMNCLNTGAFFYDDYGKQYLKTKNNQLNYQRGQYYNQQQSPLSSQGEKQRNAAANNVQGAQSHWANITDNKRSRKAF